MFLRKESGAMLACCILACRAMPPRYRIAASECNSLRKIFRRNVSLRRIYNAAKSDRARAIAAGRHQQIFLVFIEAVGLGEIPYRSARLVERASAQDCRACMFIAEFIGPLRNVSRHVQRAVGAYTFRKCIHIGGRAHGAGVVGRRKRRIVPLISPGI
jgi:hypothetical protein